MLQEPYLSQYDLQFKLLGFPVRIAWGFWALAAVLGFEFVSVIDQIYFNAERTTPGTFPLLIVHSLALCLSILIHELDIRSCFVTMAWTVGLCCITLVA